MADPFIAQIVMFGGNFAPRGWAFCDGQLLPIAQYSALFSILGTTYGGDGRTTFALPDLRGRAALHQGNGPGLSDRRLGAKGGTETNTLTIAQLPNHNHTATATAFRKDGPAGSPEGLLTTDVDITQVNNQPVSVGNSGGGQSVNNMQPWLAVNYIIALQGVFPSRS